MATFSSGTLLDPTTLPAGTDPALNSEIDTYIKVNDILKGYVCSQLSPPVFIGFKEFGLPSGVFQDYLNYKSLTELTIRYNNEDFNVNLNITQEDVDLEIAKESFFEAQGLSASAIMLIMEESTKGNAKAIAVRDWIRSELRAVSENKGTGNTVTHTSIPYTLDEIIAEVTDNAPTYGGGSGKTTQILTASGNITNADNHYVYIDVDGADIIGDLPDPSVSTGNIIYVIFRSKVGDFTASVETPSGNIGTSTSIVYYLTVGEEIKLVSDGVRYNIS